MNRSEMIKSVAWLGTFVDFHTIGEYSFVEYKATVYDGGTPKVPEQFHEESSYSAFINGRGTSSSYANLDEALAGTIAYKHDGCNSRAGELFIKAITFDSLFNKES